VPDAPKPVSPKTNEPRVYEYVTDDGTVLWSLTRLPTSVSLPTKLTNKNRKGVLFGHFMGMLRLEVKALQRAVFEDDVVG